MSDSLQPHGLYSPWNSPGQNSGVGSVPFSRASSQVRDRTCVSRSAGGFFTSWGSREAPNDKKLYLTWQSHSPQAIQAVHNSHKKYYGNRIPCEISYLVFAYAFSLICIQQYLLQMLIQARLCGLRFCFLCHEFKAVK